MSSSVFIILLLIHTRMQQLAAVYSGNLHIVPTFCIRQPGLLILVYCYNSGNSKDTYWLLQHSKFK